MSESQTLSPLPSGLEQAISSDSIAEILATSFPPLRTYVPTEILSGTETLPGISAQQALFLLLDCREAFYGGAAGGGKSAALLMAALQYVDEPRYSALLLRRTFPELEGSDGLISQAHEWLGATDADWNEQKHRWTFPSGSTIQFGHVETEQAKTRYQGQAYQLIGFDELTHFTETQYDYIAFSRARRSMELKERRIPIRARATSNPGNIGHGWVKERFIDKRKPEVVFIPARVADNPGLDVVEYSESLGHLNDELRRQLLEGDWGAFEGAAYSLSEDHLINAIPLRDEWERFESMDYGITNPTAWLAWAVDFEGNLITFGSWYKPGLPSETAPVIQKLRQAWKSSVCWGDPQSLAQPTSTLNKFGQPATIESEFADLGVPLVRANNDRRRGYTRLCELLRLDPARRFPDWHPRRGEAGSPRWFIVERTCPELIDQLRSAPLEPIDKLWHGEAVESYWESHYGHAHAAARYGAMSRPSASDKPQVLADPRARILEEHRRAVQEENVSVPYEFV